MDDTQVKIFKQKYIPYTYLKLVICQSHMQKSN